MKIFEAFKMSVPNRDRFCFNVHNSQKESHAMNISIRIAMAVSAMLLYACANKQLFPQDVMEKVTPTFQFEAWRDASPSNPSGNSDAGIRVELGGRIVWSAKDDRGIVIVAEQLPIVRHPAYGPTEDIKRASGDYEFAFRYPGELAPQDLKNGNRVIVVGTTARRQSVVINGLAKSKPFLMADCVHVWQTGRIEISEFKESVGGGYSPLAEKTYCSAQKKMN